MNSRVEPQRLAPQLVGFAQQPATGELLAKWGVPVETGLIEEISRTLRGQHAEAIVTRIELLSVPKWNLGGVQTGVGSAIRVQTVRAPLDLRLTVEVGVVRLLLDVEFVLIIEGLDSLTTVGSDMHVRAQRPIA